jgi:hypothetical protein
VEAAEARHPAAVRRFRRGRRDDLVLAIGVKATNASELARLARDDAGDRRALPQGPDAHAALAGLKAEHLGWFANYKHLGRFDSLVARANPADVACHRCSLGTRHRGERRSPAVDDLDWSIVGGTGAVVRMVSEGAAVESAMRSWKRPAPCR